MHYDVIGISDLHLGARNCELKKLRRFLHKLYKGKNLSADVLLVMGDGVDKHDLSLLKKKHWKVLKLLKKLQRKMQVVWLVGNHDPDKLIISEQIGIHCLDYYRFDSGGIWVFACHGHVHDTFLEEHPIIVNIADTIYNASQIVDPSHKLAKLLKRRSKKFLKAAKKIGFGVAATAYKHECKIAWHGHNHHAGHAVIDGIDVWDSGCWTEKPCTYLTILDGQVVQHEFH